MIYVIENNNKVLLTDFPCVRSNTICATGIAECNAYCAVGIYRLHINCIRHFFLLVPAYCNGKYIFTILFYLISRIRFVNKR